MQDVNLLLLLQNGSYLPADSQGPWHGHVSNGKERKEKLHDFSSTGRSAKNIALLLTELVVNGPKGFRKFLRNRCTELHTVGSIY